MKRSGTIKAAAFLFLICSTLNSFGGYLSQAPPISAGVWRTAASELEAARSLPSNGFRLFSRSGAPCLVTTQLLRSPLRSGRITVRWFRKRALYSANCDASRQVGRIVFTSPVLLAGDVELNPGPDRNVAERRRRADRSPQGNGADTGVMSRNLSLYYQNVRSLKNKLSVLRSEAPVLKQYDVIGLTETWLNDDVSTAELQVGLESHAVFRKDREGRIGGGVAIAAKTELMPQRRADSETNCECLVVQIGSCTAVAAS